MKLWTMLPLCDKLRRDLLLSIFMRWWEQVWTRYLTWLSKIRLEAKRRTTRFLATHLLDGELTEDFDLFLA